MRRSEGGGYKIIAGHRRQRASELAGFVKMPCIVRNMADDEDIIPTGKELLAINTWPKNPDDARNLNACVIG